MSAQRRYVLLALCGLLLLALYYAWGQSSSRPLATGTEQQRHISRGGKIEAVDDNRIVPLKSYHRTQGVFQKPQKNLFGSVYPSAPAVPVRPVTPVNQALKNTKNQLSPVATTSPPPPPFTVIGHLMRGGELTVFLATPDGEVHLVQAGTRFAGNALVQYIDRQEIIIAAGDGQEPLVLPIDKAENMRFPSQRMESGRMDFVVETAVEDDDEAEAEGKDEAKDETKDETKEL